MTKSQEEEEEVVEQDQDISGKSLELILEAQKVSGHMSEGLGSPGKSVEVLVKYFGRRFSLCIYFKKKNYLVARFTTTL